MSILIISVGAILGFLMGILAYKVWGMKGTVCWVAIIATLAVIAAWRGW